jgi:DNA polymerase-3 subunit epsilon
MLTKKRGVIWDVETTGLDPETDVIIEVGAVKFEWTEELIEEETEWDDQPVGTTIISEPRIVSMYGGLCDPLRPLPENIIKLTGITDDDVQGKSLDEKLLFEMAADADVLLAHNMEFDRSFLMRRSLFDGLVDLKWACTLRHIDWAEKGFKSSALTYLAADHGFVNPFPHRALFDCATTFKLMKPHFPELLKNRTQKMFCVSAWGSSFSTKDKLRERKYQWDAGLKVWKKTVLGHKVEEEKEFLHKEIYGHLNNAHTVTEVPS